MRKFIKTSLVLLLMINHYANGQVIAYQEIDNSKISTWIPKFTVEYTGVYHFGDSESESELIIFFSGDKIIGQIKSGLWYGTDLWKWNYENLNEITIDKNGNFNSDKYHGQFVKYTDNDSTYKALKIVNPWSEGIDIGEYEIGIRLNVKLSDKFAGKYPNASLVQLDKDELKKMTESELKIMRNEIYARYGFKFKSGGKMGSYFKKQNWYSAQHENIDNFLTEIEKENIKIIQEIEKEY